MRVEEEAERAREARHRGRCVADAAMYAWTCMVHHAEAMHMRIPPMHRVRVHVHVHVRVHVHVHVHVRERVRVRMRVRVRVRVRLHLMMPMKARMLPPP